MEAAVRELLGFGAVCATATLLVAWAVGIVRPDQPGLEDVLAARDPVAEVERELGLELIDSAAAQLAVLGQRLGELEYRLRLMDGQYAGLTLIAAGMQ
jgi:hypothetical protein